MEPTASSQGGIQGEIGTCLSYMPVYWVRAAMAQWQEGTTTTPTHLKTSESGGTMTTITG